MRKIYTSLLAITLTALSACSSVEHTQNNYQRHNHNITSQQNELRSELPQKNFNGSSVFYESYSSKPNELDQLDKILMKEAARLKGNAKQAIKIVGYTDDEGSSSYNLALAQQRIDFIAERLRKLGVNWQQIQRYPVGAEKSHCGEDQHCKKLMRRVDLIPLEY